MTVYWVNTFTSIRDRERLQRYADLAGPAMREAGGRFIARGAPLAILEGEGAPDELRTTLIEFPDLDTALAAYRSEGYQNALRALGDAATRDIRIVAAAEG
jgi:uncharacterized protein (DUF1330 family)